MKKLIPLLLLPGFILFVSCKKKQDDSNSNPTFKDNLCNHWKLIQVTTREGVNVTEMYKKYDLDMNKDNSAKLDLNVHYYGPPGYSAIKTGSWNLKNNQSNLLLDFEETDYDGEFKILKLKTNELSIERLINEEQMHFVPR